MIAFFTFREVFPRPHSGWLTLRSRTRQVQSASSQYVSLLIRYIGEYCLAKVERPFLMVLIVYLRYTAVFIASFTFFGSLAFRRYKGGAVGMNDYDGYKKSAKAFRRKTCPAGRHSYTGDAATPPGGGHRNHKPPEQVFLKAYHSSIHIISCCTPFCKRSSQIILDNSEVAN